MAQDWVPAFEGQRPPFTPGHTKSLQHGTWSERTLAPVVGSILEYTLADEGTAYLREPRYRAALEGWARAEAKVLLLERYLARRAEEAGEEAGDLGDKRVETAYRELHKAEKRAESGRSALGLTPMSRVRLGRDVAATQVDLASLLSDERERAEGGPATDRGAGQ